MVCLTQCFEAVNVIFYECGMGLIMYYTPTSCEDIPAIFAAAEGTAAQQLKLTVLAIRTCALPLGRGALTLGTLRPLPTEPLHIPPLCLGGWFWSVRACDAAD